MYTCNNISDVNQQWQLTSPITSSDINQPLQLTSLNDIPATKYFELQMFHVVLILKQSSTCVMFQFHAMHELHANGYNVSKAIADLVPAGGPVLCRDEMEEWSAGTALGIDVSFT